MVEQGWNIGIMAGMSAGFSGNIDMGIDYNETERETFDRYTKEQLLYSRGAPPPPDGNALTWASSTFEDPNVLSFSLDRLDNLYLLEYVRILGIRVHPCGFPEASQHWYLGHSGFPGGE